MGEPDFGERELVEESFPKNYTRLWGKGSPNPDLDILDGPGGNVIDRWELKGNMTTGRIDQVAKVLKDGFVKKFGGTGGKVVLDMRKSPLSDEEVFKGIDDALRKGYMQPDDTILLYTKTMKVIVPGR